MYRAVLFDLDGTLLDTLADLAGATNEALVRRGHPTHHHQAYRRFVGDGIRNLAARALPPENAGQTHEVDAMVAAMSDIYRERYRDHTAPYPGIVELLVILKRRGVKSAVLSNKPHDMTRLLVAELLPHAGFVRVEGARVGVARKPDPRMAREIAHSLDVAPHDFLYVGDTDTDMYTAAAAGMRGIGALWGYREADELLAAGAATLAAEPLEVAAFLD